ncbi:single Ig IL-1-related receptor [Chanos chanos]|uniref:Single Ig IL-1-related receptor n=1 Tax=Chanos chanos TaxID=29144 RepID=A0A6J2WQP3_CHACN|nr:single Ig IL-1-related receptor [Chanos chanos]
MGTGQMRVSWICLIVWSHVSVTGGDLLCSRVPEFTPVGGERDVWAGPGSSVSLTCSAVLGWNSSQPDCNSNLTWSKDDLLLSNLTGYPQNTSFQFPGDNQAIVTSVLTVSLREPGDFGLYSCHVRNASVSFSVQRISSPSHTGAVIAAVVLVLTLALAAVVYTKCRLHFKLWYKTKYGDYEMNDGKTYDAYVSYVNNDNDRKFVNFILKPHLENKYGQKLLLNDTDILPGAEPSAELLMNISRCRRLIVVLSEAYLEQEWCTSNFRQGLWHLLELTQKPIFITFLTQQKHMSLDVAHQLREHQPRITTLIWKQHSMTPSSSFWKELALAMPRKVVLHSQSSAGDPQTLLQEDDDPMLTQQPDYLDCRPDPDPAGDLGLRLPVYRGLSSKAPVLPAAPEPVSEPKPPEIDVSDLGSRNYAARTDFYCLVTEDDI